MSQSPKYYLTSVLVCLFIVSFGGFAAIAQTQENALNCFADGMDACEVEDWAGAVEAFKKAIALAPDNLEYQYQLALTYGRLEQDRQALDVYKALIDKDPDNYFKAYFDMAALHSRSKDYRAALRVLDRAEKAVPDNPRVQLEKGYVLKNLKAYERAEKSFARAAELDPQLVQQAAYDTAVLYFEIEQFDRSLALFEHTIALDPQSVIAKNANVTILQVKAVKRARKPWYLTTSFGWAYDDAIPLDPLGSVGPGQAAVIDEGDRFQTLMLRGGYKHINRKDVEVGFGYGLFCVGYQNTPVNNILAHMPHAYLQVNRDPFFLRLAYEFSYYYAGGDDDKLQDQGIYLTFGDGATDKLRIHSIMPTLTIVEPYNMKSDLVFQFQNKTYLDGVSPDANFYSAGIIQSVKLPKGDIFARLGYRFGYEDADTREATYDFHEFMAGCSAPLRWKIRGDASFTYTRTDYDTFVGVGDRRDKTHLLAVSLARPVLDYHQVQLAYNYTKNDSNVVSGTQELYDFSKNVFIGTFTLAF